MNKAICLVMVALAQLLTFGLASASGADLTITPYCWVGTDWDHHQFTACVAPAAP